MLTDGRTGIAYGSSTGSTDPIRAFGVMLNDKSTASITATTRATNPRRTQELDTFHYTLNQSTHITGSSSRNRAVSQTQTAQLVAAYHQSLLVSAAPRLDTTSASQNYLYNKVEDSSSTEAHLAYDNGEAIRATLTQAASRSLHTLRVENNQITGNSANNRLDGGTGADPFDGGGRQGQQGLQGVHGGAAFFIDLVGPSSTGRPARVVLARHPGAE